MVALQLQAVELETVGIFRDQ